MRHQGAIAEQSGAGPGAEGQDEFKPLFLDQAEALNLSVIEHAGRAFELRLQCRCKVEACPTAGAKVRRGQDRAVAHDARESR